jgi:hypothetical protein
VFGLYSPENLIGGAILGEAWHIKKYGNWKNTIELRRMALIDNAPKNSESYFIGKICWYIKKHSGIKRILSYCDTSRGHKGTIYKASGFKCVGFGAKTNTVLFNGKEYHARSLTIDRPYANALKEKMKDGVAEYRKCEGKTIWIKDL